LVAYPKVRWDPYVKWLSRHTKLKPTVNEVMMNDPTDFRAIYSAAVRAIRTTEEEYGKKNVRMTYHLSPGTPAMQAVWIILSKTLYPAKLIQSSTERGVKDVTFPFEIFAEYIPETTDASAREVMALAEAAAPRTAEFCDIIGNCSAMQEARSDARRIAAFDIPVLIYGESGTGKELFAKAIHSASSRCGPPMLCQNCAALTETLIESELFGHEKGSFTGANAAKKGLFERAHHGTLFLDEIGELSSGIQAKLLRVLQEGEFQRVGGEETLKCNVRIIAATNRNLMECVTRGTFREDLYYRLAVGIVQIPPLRERGTDLNLLINAIVEGINKKFIKQPTWVDKDLTPGALNRMHRHSWPGNVRELQNVLTRAMTLRTTKRIDENAVAKALHTGISVTEIGDNVMERPLGGDFEIEKLIEEVRRHYIQKALDEAEGNKSKAARLLGLQNYQTLANWMGRFRGMEC